MPTIDITYESGVTEDRQDAVFYVGNCDEIVEVSDGTRTFVVYVCGETRAYVWNDEIDKAGEEEPAGEVRNDGSKWAAFGIHNDEDLRNAEVRTEWIYNSWYEVYEVAPDGNHGYKGEVFHEHKEAVEYIISVLRGYLPGTTVNVHPNGVIEITPGDPAASVCGACGRGWDDEVSTALTPVPAGRCPFEYEHDSKEDVAETFLSLSVEGMLGETPIIVGPFSNPNEALRQAEQGFGDRINDTAWVEIVHIFPPTSLNDIIANLTERISE